MAQEEPWLKEKRQMSEIAQPPVQPPFLSARVIFFRFVVFAVMAGLANLAAQEAVVRLYPLWPVMISVLAGTGVGFFVKYVLEKRWVFLDDYETHTAELRKIAIYGFFGIGTTALFWAVEMGAWHLWHTSEAKYAGAVVGLSLGNWIKYLLDKHYVFGNRS
jgi:putative flippase GtrA